jgi:uncharacterized protein
MSNLATIQALYEDFGKGDIPAILDKLADNVEWESWEDNRAQQAGVPWLQNKTGKAGVVEFFQVVSTLGVNRFEVLSLLEGKNQIAAEVVIGTESYVDEEIHLWDFDADGKITRMRHYVDTAKHIAAAEKIRSAAA